MNEVWKDIEGYKGIYQVSNLGRIYSIERYVKHGDKLSKRKGRYLKYTLNKNGYFYVDLNIDNNTKVTLVHRIIAIHFIENKNNYPQVNHINGIRNDNRIENLEWITNRENQMHRYSKYNKKSIYTGVYFDKSTNKYKSSIRINGKTKNLGDFKDEHDAAMVYNKFVLHNNIPIKYANLKR